jgi:hypothetical protein
MEASVRWKGRVLLAAFFTTSCSNTVDAFLAHEVLSGKTRDDAVAHFEECNHCTNKIGNKVRLLASWIGKDGSFGIWWFMSWTIKRM